MVTREDIQATCDDIVREFAPLQVILFGSYAYGTPTEDSDVDLLVVMDIPESETSRQASEILQRIPRRFSMDLLVRSPEEIAYRTSHNDWFLREITEKGEVLYGCANICKISVEKKKSDMNPLTLEWIQTAEGNYASAQHLHQGQKSMYDIICLPESRVYREISEGVAPRKQCVLYKNARFREVARFDCAKYP